jgi:hypothetical protein
MLWSDNLNVGTWTVLSHEPWLLVEPVRQVIGGPAIADVRVDLEALADQNGGFAAGDTFATEMTVCPISGNGDCVTVPYTLRVVDRVARLHLPWLGARAYTEPGIP